MIHLYKILITSVFIQLIGCYCLKKGYIKTGNDALHHKYILGFRAIIIGIIFKLFILAAIIVNFYLFHPSPAG